VHNIHTNTYIKTFSRATGCVTRKPDKAYGCRSKASVIVKQSQVHNCNVAVSCSDPDSVCKVLSCTITKAAVAFSAQKAGVVLYDQCQIDAAKEKKEESEGRVGTI
jgi:hypothetical protein